MVVAVLTHLIQLPVRRSFMVTIKTIAVDFTLIGRKVIFVPNSSFFSYPYDITQQDCCRARVFNGNNQNDFTDFFSVQPIGQCTGAGGEIVVSESGNPHNYLVVDN